MEFRPGGVRPVIMAGVRVLTATLVAGTVLIGGTVTAQARETDRQLTAAQAEPTRAALDALAGEVASTDTAQARATLTSSEGHTATSASRDALAAALKRVDGDLSSARTLIGTTALGLSAYGNGSGVLPGHAPLVTAAADLRRDTSAIQPLVDRVNSDVKATEVPAAQVTPPVQPATQQSVPTATPAPATPKITAPTAPSSTPAQAPATPEPAAPAPRDSYTVAVRTEVAYGAAMQPAIDAGGQVLIDYPGFRMVAAHNYNDDTALSLQPGNTVTFTGALSGTYRVVSSRDIQTGGVQHASEMTAALYMQTCYWEDASRSRLVALTPAS